MTRKKIDSEGNILTDENIQKRLDENSITGDYIIIGGKSELQMCDQVTNPNLFGGTITHGSTVYDISEIGRVEKRLSKKLK